MIQFAILHPNRPPPYHYETQRVEMRIDLQNFLVTLKDFPSISCLGNLDFYDSTEIASERLNQLVWDLSELLRRIRAEPEYLTTPNEVGTTSDEDTRMPFGNAGLEKWCEDVLSLARRAQDRKISMWALGN